MSTTQVNNPSNLGKRDSNSQPVANSPPSKRRRPWADEAVRLALKNGIETDSHRIAQRQKQIDYGKNTLAYDAFVAAIPRNERIREHPATPPAFQKCSKRSFDGQVKKWRRMLHQFKEDIDKTADPALKSELLRSSVVTENRAQTTNRRSGPSPKITAESFQHCATNAYSSSGESTYNHFEVCSSEGDEDEVEALDDIELDDLGNVVRKPQHL